ncbi:MAG: diguanylate cyclase, partial [Nitrospira sp.]|nr:diguanylate cyclase [Nitrospira sp.]
MALDPQELAQWRTIQEDLAKITGLSLLTYDTKKVTVLSETLCKPSQDNHICHLLQENYHQMTQCNAHCGKQIHFASQTQQPSFFTCYANLNVFAIPVTVNQDTKLVLLGGKRFSSYEDFAKFRDFSEELNMDPQELLKEVKEISFRDHEFLKTAAKLVQTIGSVIFEGLHHREKFELTSTRLMTLFNLCTELKGIHNPKNLYPLVLSALGVLFNIGTASILIRDHQGGKFRTVESFGSKKSLLSHYQASDKEGLFGRLVEKKQPISCKVVFELLKAGLPPEITSAHLIPILNVNTTVGALAVFDTSLSDEEVHILANLCEVLGLILEKQQLHHQLKDRQKDLTVINEIIQGVTSPLESEKLFDAILGKCTELLEAEQGSLLLFDPETQELSVKAIKGLNKKIVELIRIKPGEGISGSVFVDEEPMIVQDIETDHRTLREGHPRYKSKSLISFPLKLDRGSIGVLNITDKISGEAFTEEDAQLLSTIATYAVVAIERSEFYRRSEELKKISITDSLTGLLNRRYFQERLAEELERSKRHRLPLSLIIMDIDDFKSFNDRLGHLAGDEALKTTARTLRNSIRAIDVAARYGGEEFTVILPQTTKQDATIIAERFCREIENISFRVETTQPTP